MAFYAHSGADRLHQSDWQFLRDHLAQVACRASALAGEACPNDASIAEAAHIAGLLHDLGKYRPEFQLHIRDLPVQREKTYHKQAGAAKAFDGKHGPVAFAVAGHHGGMPDSADLKSLVAGSSGRPVADEIWAAASANCPELSRLHIAPPALQDSLHADLFTRLVFSCLVDADWGDTAEHQRRVRGEDPEPQPLPLDAGSSLQGVLEYIRARAAACKDPTVAKVRDDVLHACLAAAQRPPGLFSLTVPTGGGKTLAALAFALKQAATHRNQRGEDSLRRLIYVAPYLTILDQNGRVIREALGLARNDPAFFEHHSLAEPPDWKEEETDPGSAARRAENWDAPIILTSNVQFFESLFSNKPGRCRKLHNIARSVIILDECQTLPPDLVAPTCAMLRQLVDRLGCSVLLCTATQPAFDHPELKPHERLGANEIILPDLNLFARLKRIVLTWPAKDEVMDWPEIARHMVRERAALCVVNTRRAARELFAELRNNTQARNVFHLSTSMCPAHRLAILDRVRNLLLTGEPCYLVSTQLIEAGVDVDFPFVMRELAPLEAVIQASGRCNREGTLNARDGSPGGRVVVFRSKGALLEPKKYFPPDRWYKAGRSVLETSLLNAGRLPRIDDPNNITEYFTRLYHTGDLDKELIQPKRAQYQFAEVARAYRLIDDDSVAVVVTSWQEKIVEVQALLDQVRQKPNRANFRKLIPYQVNMRRYELANAGGAVVSLDPRFDLHIWLGGYDDGIGICSESVDQLLLV